jgi:phosphoribosylanthranilate isomerase
MHRTRIKFCGITSPTDAQNAARAGADAIGLVFYRRSKRCVTLSTAREILRVLPPMVSPIGLFVNAAHDEVRDFANALNLRTVQLHGEEPPEAVALLSDFAVIKAIHCDPAALPQIFQRWRSAIEELHLANLSAFLLETAGTGEAGGSGIENDWTAIAKHLSPEKCAGLPPIIAAGGLNAENVGNVIRLLRPWAVDVSSGIEESPGIKSMEKMQRFAKAVVEADEDSGAKNAG